MNPSYKQITYAKCQTQLQQTVFEINIKQNF